MGPMRSGKCSSRIYIFHEIHKLLCKPPDVLFLPFPTLSSITGMEQRSEGMNQKESVVSQHRGRKPEIFREAKGGEKQGQG